MLVLPIAPRLHRALRNVHTHVIFSVYKLPEPKTPAEETSPPSWDYLR
jgi:hypothetical protein